MKPVANAISALDEASIQALRDGKTLTLEGEEIALEHVLIVQEATGEGAVGTSGPITVELNTEISHELRLEGLARELVSKIQAARKDAGLEVEDRILLSLRSESEDMQSAIQAHRTLIMSEVLAVELVELSSEHAEINAGGEQVSLAVAKA